MLFHRVLVGANTGRHCVVYDATFQCQIPKYILLLVIIKYRECNQRARVNSSAGARDLVLCSIRVHIRNIQNQGGPACVVATGVRPFFDSSSNMLNVAVSRAQDAFVVIGDMALFSTRTPAPVSRPPRC